MSGGYRDLLLNLRCLATGHIVELQITLKGLIDVKAGGGHANYAIARVHRLFERDTYRYEGALGNAVLEGVRCGVVRELVCRGTASGLAAPLPTPLGDLLLDPGAMLTSWLSQVGADRYSTEPLAIPSDPSLVGFQLALQALGTGTGAGPALSGAVVVTVQP